MSFPQRRESRLKLLHLFFYNVIRDWIPFFKGMTSYGLIFELDTPQTHGIPGVPLHVVEQVIE